MKKLIALLALTAASGMIFAQTGSAPTSQNAAGQQSGAQTPGSTPSTGATGAPAQAAPAGGKHQPQAKTQEEFKAYQEAASKPDPVSMEQAADAFAKQFPDSELRGALYQNVMLQYQNANNSDKMIEVGRKTLSIDPDNAVALASVASVLATRTRETDLDKEERLAEAKKDANRAIELMNSGAGVPAGLTPQQTDNFKSTITSMGYAALGQADFVNNNFAAAEQSLRKSTSIQGIQQDPITWLQLTLTLDREGKYADGLQVAQQCITVAANHPVQQYCTQERDRLQKLAANPPSAKPGTTGTAPTGPATTTSPTTPK
jgi:tetratricopeptide (TPR) repeat protein